MYKIIAILSTLIRMFYLPNPFETLGETFSLTFGESTITMTPFLLNYLAEPFLHVITFALVGLYYTRGVNSPSKGSFLYLVFYTVHVGLLYLMGQFGFALWAVVLILTLYALVHIGYNALKNRIFYRI